MKNFLNECALRMPYGHVPLSHDFLAIEWIISLIFSECMGDSPRFVLQAKSGDSPVSFAISEITTFGSNRLYFASNPSPLNLNVKDPIKLIKNWGMRAMSNQLFFIEDTEY